MNRELLKELGLTDEQIESVMKAHGKAIQAVKPDDYEEIKTENATLKQDLNNLQGALDTHQKELKSVEDLKQQIEFYKLKDLKTNIAIQAGIPLELAGRLSGETEDEIKADAEIIADLVKQKQTLPLRPTEPEKTDPKEKAYADLVDNL